MSGIIGKKLGMTREFYKTGQLVPVTVLKIETVLLIEISKVFKFLPFVPGVDEPAL